MALLRYVQSCVLLLSLAVAVVLTALESDDCSNPKSAKQVSDAVCAFNGITESVSFKSETKAHHNVTAPDGTHYEDTNAILQYFAPTLGTAECASSCEGVSRENVTWCVRIADPSRYIETCVHLDENQELVFESTCDAQSLNLQEHLSLPTDEVCNNMNSKDTPGCLGLTNIEWYFKNAYLTCISETESCRDVTFTSTFILQNSDPPPSYVEISKSPLVAQPSDTVVIRAEIIISSGTNYVIWDHGSINYTNHIAEDPFCDEMFDVDCGHATHPKAEEMRMNRVRTYSYTRSVNRPCAGGAVFSLVTYFVIDNATKSDEGLYSVTIVTRSYEEKREFMVNIVCDETSFTSKCSNKIISTNEGSNTEWSCNVKAPRHSQLNVALNKPFDVKQSELLGKENLDVICSKDEPSAFYHVVMDDQHTCYSKYTVYFAVCSVEEKVVGNYSVMFAERGIAEGSTVSIKITPRSDYSSDDNNVSPAAFIVPIGVLVCALLGIIVAMVILIRTRKKKRHRGRLSQQHNLDPIASPEAVCHKKNGLFSPVSVLSPQSTCAAFSDPLEFPRNQLYVYTKRVLGEGSFGRVLQAKADGIVPGMPERNIVAIKTTKDNATSVEIEELLAELDLMRNMKPHENILNLLGQCTTPGGPVCVIVEYARYGNLRDFLRQCEEVVLSLNHKPLIPRTRSRTRTFSSSSFSSTQPLNMMRQNSSVFTPGSGNQHFVFPFPVKKSHNTSSSSSGSSADNQATAHHPGTAVPLAHTVAPIGHDYINSKGLVYMEDVQNFALQIACGLQHLSSMEIVHCDLAARNILIAEGFVLKIADFGLARDISGREMYKKNPRGKIPVKWTAPEALENRIFTTKSDVWSFGVVLWELFTYGHSPYPDVHIGQSYETIISYLKEGNRMSQPESCSDEFYKMMMKCWAFNPEERPTPVDLVGFLTPLDTPHTEKNGDIAEINEVDSTDSK